MSENILRGSLTSTQTSKGALGFKGERGYSNYEIYVKNGGTMTEQEWLDHFGVDLTGYAKTSEVNAIVGDLEGLETTDKTDVVSAINEINADINFSNFKEYDLNSSDFIKGTNIHIEPFTMYVARTANNKYAKVYGSFGGYAITSDTGNTEFILNNTGIPVSESFYVMGVGVSTKLQSISGTDAITYLTRADLEFNTNGSITIKTNITWQTGGYYTIVLHPCLIQTKSIGDSPVEG